MRFTYVNAGAPGCVGDAGLFGRCKLQENIEAGIMKRKDIPLYLENGEIKSIFPYLVGDAAFPLGVHMMKAIDPPPAVGTSEAEYNARILLARARRVIQRAFGWLKGRWLFCKRNVFWNNLDFTRAAIEACCALHNFLEERDVVLPGEEEEVDHVGLAMIDDVHHGQTGQDTRSVLVQWV
jgi:hypothetical protein